MGEKEGEKSGANRKAREIAMTMRKRNMDSGVIADLTGLEVEEVEKL
jgi:hypothetical protein